jgi:hypothetical protein
MARIFPQIKGSVSSSGTVTSNSSSWTITYPSSGIAANDLLLLIIGVDGNPNPTTPTNWFLMQQNTSTANKVVLYGKIATGSESGTFSWTVGASEQGAWKIIAIDANTYPAGVPATVQNLFVREFSPVSDATGSTSADPGILDLNDANVLGSTQLPKWDPNFWIAIAGADSTATFSSGPGGNFTGFETVTSGGSNGASYAFAYDVTTTGLSNNPGAFTLTSEQWATMVVAIRPVDKYSPSGQAQAKITGTATTYTDKTGQAQAKISQPFNGWGQAAALVLKPIHGLKILDNFETRTASGSWGDANLGGTWQGTDFEWNVANGIGTDTASAADTDDGWLQTTWQDQEYLHLVSTNKLAVGDSLITYALNRVVSSNDYYRFGIEFTTSQTVVLELRKTVANVVTAITTGVATSLTHAANRWFWVRTQAIGVNPTVLRMRVWQLDTAEPSTWNIDTTDSDATLQAVGSVGMRIRTTSSNSNYNIDFQYDNFLGVEISGYKAFGQAQAKIKAFGVTQFGQAQAKIAAGSRFPIVSGSQTSNQNANTTTSNITLPASIAAGDLIIAFLASDSGAGANTWPSPWQVLKDEAGTGFQASIAYLIASGGETTVAVTHGSERSNHLAIRITNWHGTTPPEINTAATGSSTTPDPGTLTASWGSDDNLWIAVVFADDSATPFPITGWPTNYTANQLQSSTATSAADVGIATREFASATDDPGTFTIGTETWNAYTIVVRPVPAGGGPTTYTDKTGQAQARIKQTYSAVAQAQADVKQTYTDKTGQANADIKQTYTDKTGQAQARIKQTYFGLGQAQADIKATSYGLGQAQGAIKNTYSQVAQAQASIKTTYFGLGQSQARILTTYFGLAQSQADIKQTYTDKTGQAQATIQISLNTFSAVAQAQADIKATSYGLGQTNADIKTTYFALGQAQGTIKTTYFGLGQAQSDIKNTYYGLGQAQADIRNTYYGLGQAQSDIKQTYFGLGQAQATIRGNAFGQAQANIKATYFGLAQAQAKIKATYFGLGQANADIKATNNGLGQAQADIKNTYTVVGQAQAQIKTTYFGLAQAQAQVKTSYTQVAQAQADIKSTYVVVSQAQGTIKNSYAQTAQAQATIAATNNGLGQAQAYIYIPQISVPVADISNSGDWVRVVI